MAHLIDKDALVAEIERLKKEDGNPYFPSETADKYYARGVHFTCDGLVNFLDTLEVKEVNVENSFNAIVCKNCNTYLKEMDKDAITKALEPYKDGDKVKIIIKAQKGE